MTQTFLVDGVAGKMAVYLGSSEAPLTDPRNNLPLLRLHSDLDYVKIIAVYSGSINLPAIAANNRRNTTTTLFAHGRAGIPWVRGKAVFGGITAEIAGTLPIQVDNASGGYGGFPRTIALGADGTNVLLHESGVSRNAGGPHASIVVDWTVFVTDVLL